MTRTLLLAILLATVPATAQAQSVCAPRNQIVQALRGNYNEAREGMGLRDSRTIVELWVSETMNTWTLLQTNPEGWTCIIGSGINWRITIPDYATPTHYAQPQGVTP